MTRVLAVLCLGLLVSSRTDALARGVSVGDRTSTLTAAWVGAIDLGEIQPVMQFRITVASGDTTTVFDSVTEGLTGFEAECSIAGDTLSFHVPDIAASYVGILDASGAVAIGTFAQGGGKYPLTLRKQSMAYDNTNLWENRPQRPRPPFPYAVHEVICHNSEDDVTLAATLTIPHGPGRHPSVVLISGSGPQDRDGTMVEHKPFLVLADYLARRGIAALRYDDRGTHDSTGDFDTTTSEGFARDASAAVDFLEGHAQIDATRIGLVGHSEGGMVASMVAVSRSDVAFIVLLATTGVDGRAVLDSQYEAMAMIRGDDEETRRFDRRIRQALFDVVQDSPAGARLDEDLMQTLGPIVQALPEQDREEKRAAAEAAIQNQMHLLTSPWLRYFLTYDPRPALTRITCPVLALNGEKDLQVLPGINLPEIERALRSGENEQVDVIELEGLNHLFQRCDTGLIGEYISIPETIDPLALHAIGDWIVTRTGPVGDED